MPEANFDTTGLTPSQILTQLTRQRVQQSLGSQPGSFGYYNIPTEVNWGEYFPGSYQLPGGRWIIPGQQTPMGHESDIPKDLSNQINAAIGQGWMPAPGLTSYSNGGGYFREALGQQGWETSPGNSQGPYHKVATGPAPDPFAGILGGSHGGGNMSAALGLGGYGYDSNPWSAPGGGGVGLSYSGYQPSWARRPAVTTTGGPTVPQVPVPPKPGPGTQPPITGPAPHPWNPTMSTNSSLAPWMNAAPSSPGYATPPGLPSTSGSGPLTMDDPMSVISEIASGNYGWDPNQQGGGGATVTNGGNDMFNPKGRKKGNYWGDIYNQVWQT